MLKKIIFIFALVIFSLASWPTDAEDLAYSNANIKLVDVKNYEDYAYIFDGLQKIQGVQNLIQTSSTSGLINLKARVYLDAQSFLTDVNAMSVDRCKVDSMVSNGTISITLTKI